LYARWNVNAYSERSLEVPGPVRLDSVWIHWLRRLAGATVCYKVAVSVLNYPANSKTQVRGGSLVAVNGKFSRGRRKIPGFICIRGASGSIEFL